MISKYIMLTFVAVTSSFLNVAKAELILGDIALIGWENGPGANGDEFSIVTLRNLGASDVLYFADIELQNILGVESVEDTEDPWSFTVGAGGITAGTVINVRDDGSSWGTSANGVLAAVTSGDYYDGSLGAEVGSADDFLLFASTDGAQDVANSTNLFYFDVTGNGGNGNPLGLGPASGTNGYFDKTANFGSADIRYNGPLAGTASDLFTAISDVSNWETYTGTAAENESTALAITLNGGLSVASATPVPEPSSFVLLGILFSAGLRLGRRKNSPNGLSESRNTAK